MKTLEKTVCILLLSCILLLAARFQVFFHYSKQLKSEFRARILHDGTGVQILSLPIALLYVDAAGMEWKDNNKEVVLNGVWHEVLALKKEGAHVFVYVIEDHAETALVGRFFSEEEHAGQLAGIYRLLAGFVFTCQGPDQFLFNTADPGAPRFAVFRETPTDGYFARLIKPPCLLT